MKQSLNFASLKKILTVQNIKWVIGVIFAVCLAIMNSIVRRLRDT